MDVAPSVMKIDLDEVLRLRAPSYHRFIPRFLIKKLEDYICQDRMNRLLEGNAGLEGVDFCHGVRFLRTTAELSLCPIIL